MEKSVRMDALRREPGLSVALDDIEKDPTRGGLFKEYLRALGPKRVRADTGEIIFPGGEEVKRMLTSLRGPSPERKGLKTDQQALLQNLVLEFTRREQAAERFLANLANADQVEFAELVTRQMTTVTPEEFPLWIKGIAVRGNIDMEDLAKASRAWKTAVRDSVAERKARKAQDNLKHLADRYGVTESDLHRFIQMPDDNERYKELAAAVEGVSWFKTVVYRALYGPSVRRLNEEVKKFRREYQGVESGINGIATILCSISTQDDPWYKELPDIIAKNDALEKKKTDQLMTKEAATAYVSPQSIAKRFELNLKTKGGGERDFEAYKTARRASNGDLTALMDSPLPSGGTVGGAYDSFSSFDQANFKRQRFITSFLAAIMSIITGGAWEKGREELAHL